MPDDSPYRVKVMRLSDLKLDDDAPAAQPATTADTPAVNAGSSIPQPVPTGAGGAPTPSHPDVAGDEAVIIDEHVIGPAPQLRETAPLATAPTVPTPPVYTPPTPVGSTAASPTHAVSLNVPDELPSIEEASRKHALRPVVPLEPEEPIVVPKVFAPIARKAATSPTPAAPQGVSVEPAPRPLDVPAAAVTGPARAPGDVPPSTAPSFAQQESPTPHPIVPPTTPSPTLPTPATTTQPTVPLPTPLAPSAGGINLNALRERVLHESANPTFHAQVKSIHTDAHTEGLAELRKAKLAGADLHELRNVAHEKEGAVSPEAAAPHTDTTVPSKESLVEHMLRQGGSPAGTPPSTTHAAGIAKVASTLRALPNNESPTSGAHPSTPPPEATHVRAVPAMRTFRSDVEQTVLHNQTSVVSAIAAEEVRRTEESARIAEGRRATFTPGAYLLLGMSIVLIVLGLGGVGAYLFFTRDSPALPESGTAAFFFTEAQEVFNVTGKSRKETLEELTTIRDQTDVTVAAMTQIYLTETQGSEASPTLVSVAAANFLKRIEARTPDKLVRALTPALMLGVHEVEGNQMFLILKTDFFENAFLGMLEWERSINLDLAPLFGPIVEEVVMRETSSPRNSEESGSVDRLRATTSATTTASTTFTTTPTVPEPGWDRYGFVDMIINNKEVRALRNDAGEVALLWSFADQNTIIITTNRKTLEEILTRMNARRFD